MTDRYFYVTTPIYYVNGEPHMGSAYCTLSCDVMARFKRLDGYKVRFLTGTDEHGLKIFQAARDKGVEPQEFCDAISQKFRDLLPLMNISNDDFIRTTEPRHKRAAAALWQRLVENDAIYLSKYAGWYAVSDEAYYDESEITTNAKGEKIAIASGQKVTWMEEESYFFRLSAWQDQLVAYFTANPDAIAPRSRYNEIMSFIKSGLQDVSVSRTTFSWGIPVPNDPKHVMYVWIDALTNYLSALGFPDATPDMQHFWPEALHIVGKDIQRFHCVYWPAFLMAAGIAPPKRVFSHGWWTADGQKMSKSLGNIIMPADLVRDYGLDQTRFFLMREIPFGSDGNFSRERFLIRMNSDLANNLGNLAQRTLSFIFKNCAAQIPAPNALTAADETLLASAYALLDGVRGQIDRQQFDKALELVWGVVNDANFYIDEQAPWTLRKTDAGRMDTVLYTLVETIRCIALLLQPFMPDGAGRMLDQLGVAANAREFTALAKAHALTPGTTIPQPAGIFPRHIDATAVSA